MLVDTIIYNSIKNMQAMNTYGQKWKWMSSDKKNLAFCMAFSLSKPTKCTCMHCDILHKRQPNGPRPGFPYYDMTAPQVRTTPIRHLGIALGQLCWSESWRPLRGLVSYKKL